MTDKIRIKVIGIGRDGVFALEQVIGGHLPNVTYIAVDTDSKTLTDSEAEWKLLLGEETTESCHSIGISSEHAANERKQALAALLQNTDLLYIVGNICEGVFAEAAPIIADISRTLGILTIAVVECPAIPQGEQQFSQAICESKLLNQIDALFVLNNENFSIREQKEHILHIFTAIFDLVTYDSYVNIDFADFSTILRNSGYASISTGHATGKNKAEDVVRNLFTAPLTKHGINGALHVIGRIICSGNIELEEIEDTMMLIHNNVHPDANIIFGMQYDETAPDSISVTLIAAKLA